MTVDPFVQKYGDQIGAQLIGVARETVDLLEDPERNWNEGRCVIEAILTREDLALEVGFYTHDEESDALFNRIKSMRRYYQLEGDDHLGASPESELGVLGTLLEDENQLNSTWGRLAGEGVLLLLGEIWNYSAGDSANFKRVVDILRDIRQFILETYQQIPLQRLKVTLRKLGVLLELPRQD